MGIFVLLALGFLLGMGTFCMALWRALSRDTWAYDAAFLWEGTDLTKANPPQRMT